MCAMMKNVVQEMVLSVAIIALLPATLCQAVQDGQISAKKKTAELAAKLAVGRLWERAKQHQIDELYLAGKMSGNPAKYQERRASWEKLREEEEKAFLAGCEREVELILKGLNRDKPEGVDDYFTEEQREAWKETPRQVVTSYLDRNFGERYGSAKRASVFSEAREEAIRVQWKRLVCNVYPTEEQVDSLARGELRSRLLSQLIKGQKEPAVFEENQRLLARNFVDPILDDAKQQLATQRRIVEASDGGIRVTPKGIKKHLQNELSGYRKHLQDQKRDKKIANKVYETFPSVGKRISSRTNELAVKKFVNALDDMEIQAGQDHIESFIRRDLVHHVDREKSWNLCLEHFRDDIVGKAIGHHVGKAPKDEQADFRKFLKDLVSVDEGCRSAMGKLVNRAVKPYFDSTRDKISREQFSTFFGPLYEQTWYPPIAEIDGRYNVSVIDVPEPLGIDSAISSRSFDSAQLLEETVAKVREAEKTAIAKGLRALRRQMKIVEELQAQVQQELEEINNIPSVNELMQHYAEKVYSVWSESEFAKEYSRLFKRAADEIRRRVKDILLPQEIVRRKKIEEERQQAELARKQKRSTPAVPEPARKELGTSNNDANFGESEGKYRGGGTFETQDEERGKAGEYPRGEGEGADEHAGGGQGRGGGVGDGEGTGREERIEDDFMPDVVIDLDYEGQKVFAKVMLPKLREAVEFHMSFDSKANFGNLAATQRVFVKWLRASTKGTKDAHLYVIARVFHRAVPYGMVYDFREGVERALETVGNKHLKVHWYDKLFKTKEYKDRPTVPFDFRKKSMSVLA